MITPESLQRGDSLGIVAPSRKITREEMEGFIEFIESWGLKAVPGNNLYRSLHQFAGSDEERAEDLVQMMKDKSIKAIVCARGGYGSIRTLVKTDFSSFEKNPKWLAGFSDITVLHAYINKFMNCESLHSLMPVNFNTVKNADAIESFRQALFGQPLKHSFPSNPLNKQGEAEGEITGGNLSMLCSLNGTPYFPDVRNKILFIEDVDEYLYHIDRMMMNLSLSGVFHKISGLLIGGMSDMNDNTVPFGKSAEEIIAEIVEKFNIPVAFSFPAGHISSNMTLIFGRKATLRVRGDECSLSFNP